MRVTVRECREYGAAVEIHHFGTSQPGGDVLVATDEGDLVSNYADGFMTLTRAL